MYTMEFFNECYITQPDYRSAQEPRLMFMRILLPKKVNCIGAINGVPRNVAADAVCQTISTKKVRLRVQLQASEGPSSSLAGSAAGCALSLSAADYPIQVGQGDSKIGENGSPLTGAALYFGQATEKEELMALRESAMRSNLMEKLSEANRYGRHLGRQLREKEAALLKCKSELASMETEMQALVALAQEGAREGAKPGSRKINGKYIPSHLALRLQELHQRLVLQVADVDAVRYRDVPLFWYGMAEDVKVMGSFDGWTQGEQMSPENTGSFTKFSAILKLRPGRYEIKLLVDGEWQISQEWPTVGEGLTVNNVLVVE